MCLTVILPNCKKELAEELASAGLGQFPVNIVLATVTAIQSAVYGAVLGGIGIFLARRVGLWRDEISLTKKPLLCSLAVALFGGLLMILADVLFFGRIFDAIALSYQAKPSIDYLLATVTYGAVIEEVMLRLFTMSLIAFLLHLFFPPYSLPSLELVCLSCSVPHFLTSPFLVTVV